MVGEFLLMHLLVSLHGLELISAILMKLIDCQAAGGGGIVPRCQAANVTRSLKRERSENSPSAPRN